MAQKGLGNRPGVRIFGEDVENIEQRKSLEKAKA